MTNIPNELRYTKTHEWVRLESDGSAVVGITDHAQSLLGDIVFVESPEVGIGLKPGDDSGVIESVKAASDIYSPLIGEVTEINEALNDNPELVNSDPYGGGWLFKLTLQDEGELSELLDADAYEDLVASEEH